MRAAALALLVLVAGCPGIVLPIEAPQVELRAAQVEGAALAAELAVVNPNHEALVVEAIDWELDVDERPLARGRAELRVEVAALAPATVSLRGTLSPGQAKRLGEGAATLSGTLHLRSPRGLVAASFYGPLEPRGHSPVHNPRISLGSWTIPRTFAAAKRGRRGARYCPGRP